MSATCTRSSLEDARSTQCAVSCHWWSCRRSHHTVHIARFALPCVFEARSTLSLPNPPQTAALPRLSLGLSMIQPLRGCRRIDDCIAVEHFLRAGARHGPCSGCSHNSPRFVSKGTKDAKTTSSGYTHQSPTFRLQRHKGRKGPCSGCSHNPPRFVSKGTKDAKATSNCRGRALCRP